MNHELDSRDAIVEQYRRSAEEAFVRANLLSTRDFVTLQAFVIYLVSCALRLSARVKSYMAQNPGSSGAIDKASFPLLILSGWSPCLPSQRTPMDPYRSRDTFGQRTKSRSRQ